MSDYERELQNFVRGVKFDDTPDYGHRDKLEQNLLVALARSRRQQDAPLNTWRIIMRSRTTKLCAAAAVLIAAFVMSWHWSQPPILENISSLSFLSRACAAEGALYVNDGIVHIANEITIYPISKDGEAGRLLDELTKQLESRSASGEEINATNIRFLNAWLVSWLPVCSLDADGSVRSNEVRLSAEAQQPYTILDQAWLEARTGRFARVMTAGDKVLFGNSYDGEFVHSSEASADGKVKLQSKAASTDFAPPLNPAEFLGITAGIRLAMSEDQLRQPIQEISGETLEDGSAVRVYRAGFPSFSGDMKTYYLFKVLKDEGTVAQMEYVVDGQTKVVTRRALADTVETSPYSWNLAEIGEQDIAREGETAVSVQTDVGVDNISVRDMVERADFETYICAVDPTWTRGRLIADGPDVTSPPARMFVIIYRGINGRDVVIVQSPTFQKYFGSVLDYVDKEGKDITWDMVYTSDNGCRAWATKDAGEAWWTEFTLRESGFTPAEDRSGYFIATPDGTFLCVAVNGQLADEEVRSLVDSLVPARKYVVR